MTQVKFMPHQIEAIGELRNGNILCAGVGTGKSLTALGYFFEKVCDAVEWTDGVPRGPLGKTVALFIITTARKRDTGEWHKEFDKFGFDVPFTVDSWNNIKKYEEISGSFFIFDEQRVVGSGAWVKSFLKIVRKNQWLLLSATPGDTWTDYIPVFVANGFYKNRREFLKRHAVYSRYVTMYPKIERFIETGYLERLRRRITVAMEYEKQTVPHWEDISVDYDHALYDRIAKDRWNPWDEEPIEDLARACYLMRRVVNDNEVRARKLFWLVMAEHPRAIVFYNYDYELELIKKIFSEMMEDSDTSSSRGRLLGSDRSEGFWSGSSGHGAAFLLPEDYDFAIAEWNGHKHESIPSTKKWIYLVQYNAGAEGWNCVETDTLIFFSQSYSYKMMTQAAGRIDRLNTPFTDLYYYVFKTGAPIDKAIDRALKAKKDFNERLFLRW